MATATPEPLSVPLDRLYRLTPEVFRGLVAHGLLDGAGDVVFRDGLLVRPGPGAADDPAGCLYRMPLEVYDRVAELGLLGPDDKVELLDGLLVAKMTRHPPHVLATQLVAMSLAQVVPHGWYVRKEDPVGLPEGPSGYASVPEPDVCVVRGSPRDYPDRHPRPEDMRLVVEVADSLLADDRVKLARYAWVNVPVAWIVNLGGRAVEVHTGPGGPAAPAGYRSVTAYRPGDLVPVVIDGLEVGRIPVDDVLP